MSSRNDIRVVGHAPGNMRGGMALGKSPVDAPMQEGDFLAQLMQAHQQGKRHFVIHATSEYSIYLSDDAYVEGNTLHGVSITDACPWSLRDRVRPHRRLMLKQRIVKNGGVTRYYFDFNDVWRTQHVHRIAVLG